MEAKKIIVIDFKEDSWSGKVSGTGRSKVISTSKMRNRTARRKNRKEKGERAAFFGLKPHSKGEDFSWLRDVFLKSNVAKIRRMQGSISEIRNEIIIE